MGSRRAGRRPGPWCRTISRPGRRQKARPTMQDDFQTRAQAEGQAHGAGHVSRPRAHPRSMTPRCKNFLSSRKIFIVIYTISTRLRADSTRLRTRFDLSTSQLTPDGDSMAECSTGASPRRRLSWRKCSTGATTRHLFCERCIVLWGGMSSGLPSEAVAEYG